MRKMRKFIWRQGVGAAVGVLALAATCYAQTTPAQPAPEPAQASQTPGQATQIPQGAVTAPTPTDTADVYFAQGRYQAAIAAYKLVDPPTASSWNKMGMSYQKMYQLEEAKKCYELASKIDPKNASYLNNLGTVYQGLQLYGSAERTYRRALKIEPQNALVYKNLGTLYLVQGKINKGKHCYEEATKLDPNIFTSRGSMSVDEPADVHNRGAMNYFMARSCLQAGMTDCAISYLRASLNQGYTSAKKLATDPEFARLRGVYAFQQMLAEQELKTSPPPAK